MDIKQILDQITKDLASKKVQVVSKENYRCYTDGNKEYVDLFIRPVFVKANSKKTVTITITAPKCGKYPSNHTLAEPECNSDGLKYSLSQKIMSAVTDPSKIKKDDF